MCLILLAVEAHARYPLVLAANRDEFHDRPTRPAGWWPEAPGVLAGRDERSGGTWMGVTREGRWAAVTNHRDASGERRDAPSRGALVADFLRGGERPEAYLERVAERAGEYNGFNLLVGDGARVLWLSNRQPVPRAEPVQPGVHGLSNALLDTPWPKVVRGKHEMERLLAGSDLEPGALLDVMLDRTLAADHDLPSTGVGTERERALSSRFILTPGYGTRSSTALLLDREGTLRFVERSYEPGTQEYEERSFTEEVG
jgi:uncharacterized protein with NRDE domain